MVNRKRIMLPGVKSRLTRDEQASGVEEGKRLPERPHLGRQSLVVKDGLPADSQSSDE